MKVTRLFALLCVMVVLAVAIVPALAQDGPPPLPGDLVVGELNAPRGVALDADGNVIVAVAGSGGESQITAMTPEGEATLQIGLTGSIISVGADGTVTPVVSGMPSYASPSETTGVYRAIPHGDSLWVIFSGTGGSTNGSFWTDTVVELDRATLATKFILNLNGIELASDPDGAGYDSNVTDLAWSPDGTLFITNAGGNDLLCWTPEAGLQVVHAWTDDPVPTGIEFAENGDMYISFLGAGIAPGAAKIEHWSNGELVETFAGLTAVTDIALVGDTLYAVEMFLFGEQGPGPGDVVTVTAEGATPVVQGLVAPFGIAVADDGSLYVSYGTIAFAPGMTGGVVHITPAS